MKKQIELLHSPLKLYYYINITVKLIYVTMTVKVHMYQAAFKC